MLKISNLNVCSDIFERIIFISIFEFIEGNSFLCPNVSGFRPFDSCEKQLLSIVHDIHVNFDQNPILFFFLSGFSFLHTEDSQDSTVR